MLERLDIPLVFEIDLSFQSPDYSLIERYHEKIIRTMLLDSQTWAKYLCKWIHYISSREDLLFPKLLRSVSSVSMGLKLTDDKTITALNYRWRSKAETTDVLSFPILDDQNINLGGSCVEIGDIIVSVETAQRQAEEYGHPLTYELKWLVSHGLLHLLGWDHPNQERLNEMISCQEQLLAMNGNLFKS